MAACDIRRMCLFVRSIILDLDIPQEAATNAYKDNDGCTAMGNAQKLTPTKTRHIDIKYFALCDWVERDLIILKRIDTSISNIANHLTKNSTAHSFSSTHGFSFRTRTTMLVTSIATDNHYMR